MKYFLAILFILCAVPVISLAEDSSNGQSATMNAGAAPIDNPQAYAPSLDESQLPQGVLDELQRDRGEHHMDRDDHRRDNRDRRDWDRDRWNRGGSGRGDWGRDRWNRRYQLVCYARNIRGQYFEAFGVNQYQVQQRALRQCETRSAVCYTAGCRYSLLDQ